MLRSRTTSVVLAVSVIALAVAACGDGGDEGSTPIPQPSAAQLRAAGLEKLPLAPKSKRVDLEMPPFSNPTEVTNPLFPISDLHSAILSGRVDGKPFHTETTLLPQTRVIEWADGQGVETLVSQYVAYLDGRIQEAALDYYAQANDGSVWYFGEDVSDYRDGAVIVTEGTWLAGKHGPAQMIMPGDPRVGQVFRTENIPGIAFEEVEVKRVDETVDGPTGPVAGAMVGRELHDDGAFSDKVFAPGYGEFLTRDGGDVEAIALAVPTDALDGPPPAELEAISAAANRSLEGVRSGDWKGAASGAVKARSSWKRYRADHDAPPRLVIEMERALGELSHAVAARDGTAASTAAIDVAQSALDFKLQYLPPPEIDRARFELWARQVVVDALAGDLGGVAGDVATMELIRDRFANTVEPPELTMIDTALAALQGSIVDKDLAAAREEAAGLLR